MRWVYAKKIDVAPGASGTLDVNLPQIASKFKLVEASVYFPAGTEGQLQVKMFYGNEQILPDEGEITGDAFEFKSNKERVFQAGSKITIQYVNADATNPKTCYVKLEFEVVE